MRRLIRPIVRRQRRAGTTAVEFAICAPLFFLFLFSAIEFSRVNMIRSSADNAVYEGARRGAVPGATADDVKDAARLILDATRVRGAVVTVDPSVIAPKSPNITVTVDVPLTENGWAAPVFFGGGMLTSTLTLARELDETTSVP